MFISHLCISFDELPVKVFGPFLIGSCIFLLSFKSTLCMLANHSFSVMSANIFSQSMPVFPFSLQCFSQSSF